jgi:hypothetical protein
MKKLKQAQVFTPPWATNQMIDMLDQNLLSDHETFFFEPTCGDGTMLVVIVERIFVELEKKYNDKTKALADTLFKFYAIEFDAELVPHARKRIYDWAVSKIDRELSELEMYLIAHSLQQSIENRDFFEAMKHPIDAPSGAKAISRKLKGKL